MSYYFIYPLFWIIGKLPKCITKQIARFIYFMLYRVTGYRKEIVRENLKNSFPKKSEEELLDIERKFYRHLADVFIDSIEMCSITEKQMRKKMVFLNGEQIEEFTKGKSWIVAMVHYASWDYPTSWSMHNHHDKTYGVYHPLHNKGMDRYFKMIRTKFDLIPLAMSDVGKEIIRNRNNKQDIIIGMVSDQTPPPSMYMNWFPFFNQMTPFFTGMEKLAMKFNMPIGFLNLEKLDNGNYVGWFEVIYDGEEKVEPNEITRRYIEKTEILIRKRPELWMWSHRRWKYKYPGEDAEKLIQEREEIKAAQKGEVQRYTNKK